MEKKMRLKMKIVTLKNSFEYLENKTGNSIFIYDVYKNILL